MLHPTIARMHNKLTCENRLYIVEQLQVYKRNDMYVIITNMNNNICAIHDRKIQIQNMCKNICVVHNLSLIHIQMCIRDKRQTTPAGWGRVVWGDRFTRPTISTFIHKGETPFTVFRKGHGIGRLKRQTRYTDLQDVDTERDVLRISLY